MTELIGHRSGPIKSRPTFLTAPLRGKVPGYQANWVGSQPCFSFSADVARRAMMEPDNAAYIRSRIADYAPPGPEFTTASIYKAAAPGERTFGDALWAGGQDGVIEKIFRPELAQSGLGQIAPADLGRTAEVFIPGLDNKVTLLALGANATVERLLALAGIAALKKAEPYPLGIAGYQAVKGLVRANTESSVWIERVLGWALGREIHIVAGQEKRLRAVFAAAGEAGLLANNKTVYFCHYYGSVRKCPTFFQLSNQLLHDNLTLGALLFADRETAVPL